ncbi:MAG TPA: nuclear transport factor 2 family protein [Pyrinomonadaceae bacterium]|jgi:ketosteroid isomerase-like protein|nr:nuclear transport factor 2 family protein [Pyrinomonadaceae bacterium]
MLKTLSLVMALALALVSQSFGQNANTRAQGTGARTSTANTANSATQPSPAGETPAATRTRRSGNQTGSGGKESATEGVVAAFDALIDGIRRADVNAVTAVYWNSPRLLLFNYNGSITKGWEQMRKNRESSYPELKDVKIEVHDRRVEMLGRDGALVTCLWTQSQTYRGTPETASGRMTLVFRRAGTSWKAIHLHTSPDAPDPSRVPSSEQTTEPAPKPTPKPKPTP